MKKNKKKIVIVGSGITGLSAALYAINKKLDVEIFDTKPDAGGILKDTNVEDKNYITGCQYLMKNSFWYKFSPKEITKELRETKINYMSYCDIFNNKNKILRNYPDLFFENKVKLKTNKVNFKSLFGRCSHYPSEISAPLLKWLKRFDINSKILVSDSNRNGLMFSRIFLQKNNEIKNLKKKNKVVDDLYGIPRKKSESLKGLLPLNGYDFFFRKFINYLENKNVKFNFQTPVVPIWKNNKVSIKFKGKIVESDYVLWTGNPVPLIKNFNSKFLDSTYFKVRVLTFKVDGNFKNDFYIQVYSKKNNILRLFFYSKNDGNYCSLECFDENYSTKNICNNANKIVQLFKKNLFIKNNVLSDTLQKRFSLLTIKDNKILKNFKKEVKNSNLIPSPWEFYSSQKKLMLLKSTMDKYI